jgi:hypothetical protein
MTSADSAPASRPERDVLSIEPGELRDTIRVTIDRELIDELDSLRGSVSRSEYVEMVLTAALEREHPHLPEDWTPERAAEHRFARLVRYRETGR